MLVAIRPFLPGSGRNTKQDGGQGHLFKLTKQTPLLSAEQVGGKAHNLIKLARMGSKVPETFVLACQEFSSQWHSMQVSDAIRTQLKLLLDPNAKYSVRSSANVEDGLDSAYAGKFTTTLNVQGVENICLAIAVCWKSLVDLPGGAPKDSSMGVVIMKQIDSTRAGVLFQVNPVTLSRATQVVTAAYGQGEGVVGGTLAVDTFYLRESTLEIKSKSISKKETRIGLRANGEEGVREEQVDANQQNQACLSDDEVKLIAKAGRHILAHCQSPQDIEFCFDVKGDLYILQTRPITTLNEHQTWKAPDAGLWRLNGHGTTPMSRFYSPIWIKGHSLGGFACTVYCGAAILAMDACDINGFGYYCMRQVGPKAAPKALPPPFILRTVMKLTAGKSIRAANKFWKQSLWREFMRNEYPERKKEWRRLNDHWETVLQGVQQLGDQELGALLGPLQAWGGDMYVEHAQVTMYNLAPVAWFALRAMELTNCSSIEAFACIDGFSPFSKGLVGEFRREMEIISQNPEARQQLLDDDRLLVDSQYASEKWHEFASGSCAELQHVLKACKFRLVDGYDSANSTLVETPCVMFNALVAAVKRIEQREQPPAGGIAAYEIIRSRVAKEEDKLALDQLVEDARFVAPLRDERALLTDLTACGIVHHFLLECGRRISPADNAAKGKLAVFASLEELQQLLAGKRVANDAFFAEMEQRKLYRETAKITAAPAAIGGPVLTPGPEYFPSKHMARSIGCVMFVMSQIFDAPDLEEDCGAGVLEQNDPKEVVGFAAGASTVRRGVARVISTPEDCALFVQGEICITKYPSSAINLILHKTNGIVTDMGGILCHAAICAREEALPCVVGCHTATQRIKTGDLVEVDGKMGRVRII
ncbi:hypothetical protein BASA82_001088 [Batrachochytrium salamandrivorans]|nr:hypothetical protein BASA81_004795 [Batrachochytrium salamandrivorans]KAH9260890.1 hypothetical protein BASA82_001088 [Batrachochytrium salamandrivorans]